MKPLRVTSIQRGCVYDGPGIRTTVFLKGCTLSCPWCCNPEAISREVEFFMDWGKCLVKKGIKSDLCKNCVVLGGWEDIEKCLYDVKKSVSHDYSCDELFEILLKDKQHFKNGGVTLSGGEPLLYASALQQLLIRLSREDISVYVETTFTVPIVKWNFLMPFISGFIVDLKLQRELKLRDNQHYLETLSSCITEIRLRKRTGLLFRLVFVNSVFEDSAIIIPILKQLSIESIELLRCHNLGQKKYEMLNQQHSFFSVDDDKLIGFQSQLLLDNIQSTILSV